MPFYDYQCTQCGTVKEELRSINARDDLKDCSKCQKKTMIPIVSGHLLIQSKEVYMPKSTIEKLTGPNVKGPGLSQKNKMPFLSSCKHRH
ncbi:MAG: zinc ribbon domain-containing protein [Alphaproteobacteria bacterium]|nr:zinc ribbon domain-containing protein [Alphaproteobacteria bacterium]